MATGSQGVSGLAQRVSGWFSDHQAIAWWTNVLRLGLFQLGMGVALAPITGTLNRVLIGDMHISAALVASLMAIHYFVSPVRAVFGYRSDVERARGRWRMPYVALGLMLTYGGLATAPFSLILLGPNDSMPFAIALIICTAIFLAYGVGVNIVETTYLALVSDITPPRDRGKVLAVLWMMLVVGTIVSSIIIGAILERYSPVLLIQVMQGSAVIFAVLATISLLGREQLRPDGTLVNHTDDIRVRLTLVEQLRVVWRQPGLRALFIVLFGGTLALATHDVLLEPYGERPRACWIVHRSVGCDAGAGAGFRHGGWRSGARYCATANRQHPARIYFGLCRSTGYSAPYPGVDHGVAPRTSAARGRRPLTLVRVAGSAR
jgi:BCD family chlorophyll transporter-like MFS transporter